MYLSDKLVFNGGSGDFARLLAALQLYKDDVEHRWTINKLTERAGVDIVNQTIYGDTPGLLARMRRIVTLFMRLDCDLHGGLRDLASDEHLCVEFVPDAWYNGSGQSFTSGDHWTEELLRANGWTIPWELTETKCCQIIRGARERLDVTEARRGRLRAVVDLRRIVPDYARADYRGLAVGRWVYEEIVARVYVLDYFADMERLRRESCKVHSLATFREVVDEVADVTWITERGVEGYGGRR